MLRPRLTKMFRPFLCSRSKATIASEVVYNQLKCIKNSRNETIKHRLREKVGGIKTAKTKPEEAERGRDIAELADRFAVRLTKDELTLLRKQLDRNGDGFVSRGELWQQSQKALEDRAGREICLSVICQPKSNFDQLGTKAAVFCDYLGTFMFAAVGTQVAGDAGMNIVGCTLVGCAAAMGGGSLNGVLYGANAPIYGRPGVRWVKEPSFLLVAMAASVSTFIFWPYYCQRTSDHYLRTVIGDENLEEDGSVSKEAFVAACKRDKDFLKIVRGALPETVEAKGDPAVLFHHVDTDNSGFIDDSELKELVQKRFNNSFETFTMDTLALAGLSVAAVHGAVRSGLHPLVAATSGVTICWGGILRDVLCGRDLALGGQSYALSTASGSTVYVLLRELCLRGFYIPLVGRIFLSAGTIIAMRAFEYSSGRPLLGPMHGENKLTTQDFLEPNTETDEMERIVSSS